MWSKKAIAELDKHFPPRGPCALCGHKDARHRLWDAIMDRADAGEIIEELSADYDVTFEGIRAVMQIRPYRRGGTINRTPIGIQDKEGTPIREGDYVCSAVNGNEDAYDSVSVIVWNHADQHYWMQSLGPQQIWPYGPMAQDRLESPLWSRYLLVVGSRYE